jgi:hypothetical protein
MDPEATLIALLEAIDAREREDAEALLDNLMTWIEQGGFPPNCAAAITTLNERRKDRTA